MDGTCYSNAATTITASPATPTWALPKLDAEPMKLSGMTFAVGLELVDDDEGFVIDVVGTVVNEDTAEVDEVMLMVEI